MVEYFMLKRCLHVVIFVICCSSLSEPPLPPTVDTSAASGRSASSDAPSAGGGRVEEAAPIPLRCSAVESTCAPLGVDAELADVSWESWATSWAACTELEAMPRRKRMLGECDAQRRNRIASDRGNGEMWGGGDGCSVSVAWITGDTTARGLAGDLLTAASSGSVRASLPVWGPLVAAPAGLATVAPSVEAAAPAGSCSPECLRSGPAAMASRSWEHIEAGHVGARGENGVRTADEVQIIQRDLRTYWRGIIQENICLYYFIC